MKNFNLIAFVLSGLASLLGMVTTEYKVDTEGIKSDTAAVAAYVALESKPATTVPTPTIKLLPSEAAAEPAEQLGGVRLPGDSSPFKDDPGKPASPKNDNLIALESAPASPPPLPAATPPTISSVAPAKAPAAIQGEWYQARWRPLQRFRRCRGGLCSG